MLKKVSDIREKEEQLFNQYWRYSSYLKNWFIGYGVGALILLIDNREFFDSNTLLWRVIIFIAIFIAIFSQVLVTILNKYSQYCLYQAKQNYIKDREKIFQRAFKISECVWLDQLADWTTMVMYLLATIISICFI